MRKISRIILFILLIILFTGCSQENVDSSKIFSVYYLNNDATKVVKYDYTMEATSQENQLVELIAALGTVSAKLEYKAPLAMGFNLLDYDLEDGKIVLNFDDNYSKMSSTTEVLTRVAIVRTLSQLPSIAFVSFTVNGNQLTDSLGSIVGWMNVDNFIESDGTEIYDLQQVRLKLYFTNEYGDRLILTNRIKEYNTNISMEKLIVEELIKGPSTDGVYPTINPETKIVSVTIKDGVCYVNLDDKFLTQPYTVSAESTIFSITNSLVELSNVNKVQISINGDTAIMYREKYSLATYYERNLDIVTTLEY